MSAIVQFPTNAPVRRRQATPERWQRALQRAELAGVQARQLQGSGQCIVTSASDPGAAYETDGQDCTCPAAMLGSDPVCLHRAAYLRTQGLLDPHDPDPTPPAAPCRSCGGSRTVGMYIHNWRLGCTDWVGDTDCISCDGSGKERQVSIKAPVELATTQFQKLWSMLDLEMANALLAEAAAIDRGDHKVTTAPGWWHDEAARAATHLRFVNRTLERKYNVAARTGQEPDPEELRPHTQDRDDWLEWQAHCEYMAQFLTATVVERLAA